MRRAIDRVFASHVGDRHPLSEAGAEAFVATPIERFPPASRLALQFKEENQELWRLTEDQMVMRTVAERLDRLVFRENVAPYAIAIVSTRTMRNSPFAGNHRAGRLERVNLDDRRRRSSSAGRRVVFDTLHRFKGVERDVVILPDLPWGGTGVSPQHRYVAASRPRNLLVVVRLIR